MTKKKPTKDEDLNVLAHRLVQEATGEDGPPEKNSEGKNPHAVALGRLGGKKGGPARAKKLSKKKRSAIARKAAIARWNKTKS